jgi:RES domain-containing protein
MDVYRISLTKWADSLTASGMSGRWNSKGKRIIYTAESRSLACLENVVHRSGEGLQELFSVMVIRIPDGLKIKSISLRSLPPEWNQSVRCAECREKGNAWLESTETAVLKVPSALVLNEFNYLLNPLHPDFGKVRLMRTEPFAFDARLKA